jgi:DNA-binding transcriptional LysR family regulator
MNLQQLTTFCAVLSEGSMTAAADKLFLTQPAVSQQIRNLEEELGVELLVRGVRQVKSTIQGQMLYDYAKRILFLTQQAEVSIRAMSQEISGDLRIGTLNSIGLYMISPIIGMFLKHNSRLKIKLVYGTGEKIISEMRNKNINIAILPDLKKEYGIEFEHFEKRFLFKDEMWLVVVVLKKKQSTPL